MASFSLVLCVAQYKNSQYICTTKVLKDKRNSVKIMKRTVAGTIGHRSFQVEEDAWQELTAYLDSLHSMYKNEPDRHEIIRDIEDRIGEHLWEWRGAQGLVISMADVQRVIGLVGNAQDIDTEAKGSTNAYYAPRKKLYRDPDNRVFGGVCSGLAYYFRADVVLIRVISVVLLFVAFSSFWVYIILWIITPKASTRAQKLEMRGIPVTPENLNKFQL